MHNHPWTVALLAMTHIMQDMQRDPEALEAFVVEGVNASEVMSIIEALEQICDVSYR